MQLVRNVDMYGGMKCKGFKPGERVILKRARKLFLNVEDSRECVNKPDDDEQALAEVVRITPKVLELALLDTLPYFVNEEFTTKRYTEQKDFYITKETDLEDKLNKLENLKDRCKLFFQAKEI